MRWFAPITGLLVLLAASAWPAMAQMTDAFSVSGVAVDVRAASAAAAREQALAEGQQIALRRVLERLVPAAYHDRLPAPSPAEIAALVRDVGIESEKASSVRYIANLSVRFRGDAIRGFLRAAGLPYAEARRQPVVVLPVYTEGAEATLWGDPNPWRYVWARRRSEGLVPIIVPLGELADVTAVSAEQALAADPAALAAVAGRYGATDTLVALAVAPPTDGGAVEVRLFASGPGVPLPERSSFQYVAAEGETRDALLARAAADVVFAVGEAYKRENLLEFDRGATMATVVPLGGLDDWLTVRRRLDRVPQVRAYQVVSLNRTNAALLLDFVGDQQQLQTALMRNGLELAWADGQWLMHPLATASEQR